MYSLTSKFCCMVVLDGVYDWKVTSMKEKIKRTTTTEARGLVPYVVVYYVTNVNNVGGWEAPPLLGGSP